MVRRGSVTVKNTPNNVIEGENKEKSTVSYFDSSTG